MSKDNLAIVLVNTGSIEKLKLNELEAFLKRFLSDKYVVNLPKIIWQPILNHIILKKRPSKIIKHYNMIFKDNINPYYFYLSNLTEKLKIALNTPNIFYANLYSRPLLEDTIIKLKNNNIKNILLVPLYPQQSKATSGLMYDLIGKFDNINIKVCPEYYDHKLYIKAIVKSLQEYKLDEYTLVFSYHNMIKSYINESNRYDLKCQRTTNLICKHLGIKNYYHVYQSAIGPSKWLEPTLSKSLESLKMSKAKVAIIAPGFAIDCLETLYEIDIEQKMLYGACNYEQKDNKSFVYIKALNDTQEHVNLLSALIHENLA